MTVGRVAQATNRGTVLHHLCMSVTYERDIELSLNDVRATLPAPTPAPAPPPSPQPGRSARPDRGRGKGKGKAAARVAPDPPVGAAPPRVAGADEAPRPDVAAQTGPVTPAAARGEAGGSTAAPAPAAPTPSPQPAPAPADATSGQRKRKAPCPDSRSKLQKTQPNEKCILLAKMQAVDEGHMSRQVFHLYAHIDTGSFSLLATTILLGFPSVYPLVTMLFSASSITKHLVSTFFFFAEGS